MGTRREPGSDVAAIGRLAEELAFAYLQGRGLVPMTRNYRCRLGEIDLIMRDRDSIVFVEVRLRTPGAHASAAESIDLRKQRKIVAAARYFLAGRTEQPCRFDCVLLERPQADAITWIKSAFEA